MDCSLVVKGYLLLACSTFNMDGVATSEMSMEGEIAVVLLITVEYRVPNQRIMDELLEAVEITR